MKSLLFPDLVRGVLLQRYKRFLIDAQLQDGSEVTASVANPGRMTGGDDGAAERGYAVPSQTAIYLQPVAPNYNVKHAYRWMFAVEPCTGALVGVYTMLANRAVREALEAREASLLQLLTERDPNGRRGTVPAAGEREHRQPLRFLSRRPSVHRGQVGDHAELYARSGDVPGCGIGAGGAAFGGVGQRDPMGQEAAARRRCHECAPRRGAVRGATQRPAAGVLSGATGGPAVCHSHAACCEPRGGIPLLLAAGAGARGAGGQGHGGGALGAGDGGRECD
eukprot:ctg_1473.g386